MKKHSFLLSVFFILIGITPLFSQSVTRKVIIEHFTNTYCSVCSSKNPAFYDSLEDEDYADVLHIAYHPSSPYPMCYFNQQNKEENDGRTNYYSVYGSTPRIVIEGTVIAPSTPLLKTSTLDTFLNKTVPFSISLNHEVTGTDSIIVTVTMKKTESHPVSELVLYAALSEDTVFYSAANGEDVHFDVFRLGLFPAEGIPITLANANDSVMVTTAFLPDPDWDFTRLSTTAMIHDAGTKKILNVERLVDFPFASGNPAVPGDPVSTRLFPNPAGNELNLQTSVTMENIEILNTSGQLVGGQKAGSTREIIPVGHLIPGVYVLRILSGNEITMRTFCRQ